MTRESLASPPVVLTFAGTDPTSGAGLQADLLTIAALGCHALSVVTAVTVQDTTGVTATVPMSATLVAAQARQVLEEFAVRAIKIGMVATRENVAAIASVLSDYPKVPVVIDPVLASGRGDALAAEGVIEALLERLVPRADVLTPNSVEARRLAADDTGETLALAECARRLIERGARHVLVTGTHEATDAVVNTLYGREGQVREDRWERLPGSFHGSGCTLASAIAATMANGLAIEEAVREGQDFTWHALKRGLHLGRGQSLPDRFFWIREIHPVQRAED